MQNITAGQTAHGHSPVFRIVGKVGIKSKGGMVTECIGPRGLGGLRSPTGHWGTPGHFIQIEVRTPKRRRPLGY